MLSGKYQVIEEPNTLNDPRRGHDFVHFISKSKELDKTDITKHWIGKIHKNNIDYANPLSFLFGDATHRAFLYNAIIDSFLSRVLHSMDESVPKTKIISATQTCSRLYPLTKEAENVWNKDLAKVLGETKNEKIVLEGMLKSIIYRMIIQDWDSKPENFACYPKPGVENCYIVAPFDFSFSLGNEVGGKKQWLKWEIESIAQGSMTMSKNISVAEALCETIGGLGTRTNGLHYSQNYLAFSLAAKGVLIESIDKDLQKIIVDSEGRINTKSAAFTEALGCALKEMSEEISDESDRTKRSRGGLIEFAANQVLENINSLNDEELPEGAKKSGLISKLGEYQKTLKNVIGELSVWIEEIKLTPAHNLGSASALALPASGAQVPFNSK